MKIFLIGVASLLLVLAVVYWAKVRLMALATQRFLREVKIEMQKVAWPSQNDVIGSTIVVLVAVLILTLIIVGTDEVLSILLNFVLPKTGGA